jgi:acetolactate synthase-1/2/3 large subunit
MSIERSSGRLLVDQLVLQGVNHVFGVPGESILPVLDALIDAPGLRLVVNRHESGSAFMACGYARLTGQPGVVLVARGPGACNAAVGIHTAAQDSLPLVVLVGQSGTDIAQREAFQEMDAALLFASTCKWTARIERAERIPEFIARAFQTAASGRPGPVVLALPEDVLEALTPAPDARCHQAVQAAPSDTQIATLRRMLGRAQRPIVIVGGAGWTPAASENLRVFVEANHLPVACAFRFQDLIDNRHPNYVGDAGLGIAPHLAERIRTADLVLALGARLGEATTGGYSLLQAPVPAQALIHVHAALEELGRAYQAELMINAGMPQMAARLAMMTPIDPAPWSGQLSGARAETLAWQQRPAILAEHAVALDPWQVLRELRAKLADDAIVASGAGNFAGWLHRFFPYHGPSTQLAPTGGSMGYAVPAAIAAKISAPERTVVCVSGDGDFLMSAQELATACHYGAPVLFLVFNNALYGTLRLHQERRFPGRPVGTALTNPDFAALAQSYGAIGRRVAHTAEFAPVLDETLAGMRARRVPGLIELALDPRLLSPSAWVESAAGAAAAR